MKCPTSLHRPYTLYAKNAGTIAKIAHHTLPVLLAVALPAIIAGCADNRWQRVDGAVWHTTYHITYQGAPHLADSIPAIFNRVESSLSPFLPSSLISRINRGETDSTDTMITRVMEISQRVNKASHGRFDPTVAPLVNLWGFGTDRLARQLADSAGFNVPQAQIDSALLLVGIAECSVNAGGKMQKKHPATQFNFSAVTKGLACDEVAAMFSRNGVDNYMVEIGGEIVLHGHNSHGRKWRIQVDAPAETDGAPAHKAMRVLELTDCAVATSGNYRNFHRSDSLGTFGHTIDPTTGYPARTQMVSATIVAPTCAEADAWATACMATDSLTQLTAMLPANTKMLVAAVEADTLAIFTNM